MAKNAHEPTTETRKLVESLAGRGLPQRMICALLDNVGTPETLTKYYRHELDVGEAKACAQVAGKLFEKCMAGDTASILFWHKTRMGFKETNGVEISGKDGGAIETNATISAEEFVKAKQLLDEKY